VTTYSPPLVPVFPAGYGPQASDFDTWWYQNASFFQNRIVFRADQENAATSLPDSGASTTIAYDTVLEDPYSGWNASTHLWTPPAGYSGWFQVTVTIRTVALGTLVGLRPALTGTWTYHLDSVQGASAGGAGASATFRVYLTGAQDNAGGACQLLNSGSAVNTSLTAGQRSTLEIVWISQV
jgi:hypothetical protein